MVPFWTRVTTPETPSTTTLSSEDQGHLDRLDRKLMIVRDRVTSVVQRRSPGFYLWGEGGTCKSYTVIEELDRLNADYRVHNSRMTGRGLFDILYEYPDSIHLLEDMERLFRDSMAQGVLRSALCGQAKDGQMVRLVTWDSHCTHLEFYFSGGIIMTANRPLDDLPELKALATRVNPARLQVSNRELAALMRHVALQGYRHSTEYLEPVACLEVAEYLIDHCLGVNRTLDMRLLHGGLADRLQFEAGEAETDWQDLLLARLTELIRPARESRAERRHREQEIAREIKDMPREERLRIWRQRTGKSEKALYRRLAELDGFSSDQK